MTGLRVDKPGRYRTRDGGVARITDIAYDQVVRHALGDPDADEFPVYGANPDGAHDSWLIDGRSFGWLGEHSADLVEYLGPL
jgi:hypothetical protein